MVHGKPLTVIFSFALPLLVGNLFNQLYNVVDTAIVGRALGADALAAVGSTGNINACLFLLLGGLATGVSVIVSQYWGAKKYDELRRLLGTFTTLLLAGSAVLAALGAALAEPLLRLLQLPAELLLPASHTCASRLGCCWAMQCITLPGPYCAARVIRAHRSPPWLHRACAISRWIYGSS